MDRWINKQMDKWIPRWINGQIVKYKNGLTDRLMEQMNEYG